MKPFLIFLSASLLLLGCTDSKKETDNTASFSDNATTQFTKIPATSSNIDFQNTLG
jgi:hypothetical protein